MSFSLVGHTATSRISGGYTLKKDYQPVLQLAFSQALRFLDNLDQTPVSATVDLIELRQRLFRPLTEESIDPAQVIRDLDTDVEGGLLGSAGGRFFGWVIGGSLPVALAADWLTSAWDQNAALYACSPAEAVIEEVCGQWLKELLNIPASASFALVTGCQMAHVTSLAAARTSLLQKRGWDVERQGLAGAPRFAILGGQRHGSIDRAVGLLGFGRDQLAELPVNDQGLLDECVLENALKQSSNLPTIVLMQAGDINTGRFDDFSRLIKLAHRYNAWVHIDGAFGLWAQASPKFRHLMEGAEEADSWATDGHKWLNVPFDCGYAFIADPESHRAAVSHRASYLTHDADARDQIDWNPEWSRRGRGVATYAAIRQLGKNGIAELIERTCYCASLLVSGIGTLKGAEVVSEVCLNQGLVRFLSSKPGAQDADHDERTGEVIRNILRNGEAFFEGTTFQGEKCMRISVCNWQTDETSVNRAIAAVGRALTETQSSH